MEIYKLKWNRLQMGVFSLLCLKSGEELSQREIAKALKVSPTAVAKSLKPLIKENLITIKKIKNINFVGFNWDEKRAIELKRVENLRTIYLSGLLNYLEENLTGGTIILFGSYARGEDVKSSDIDIAVIERKEKPLKLGEFELALNRKINVQFYNSWKEIHKHLKNNILNGILLTGSIDL
mgnify:CR=1 FL=1